VSRSNAIRAAGLLVCAFALSPAPAQTIDLSQAYAAALAQDASLRASRAAAEAGREAEPQARARLLPDVSADVTRSRNHLNSTSTGAEDGPLTTRDRYTAGSASLTARQPLYRPLEMANLRQAQARVDESEAVLARDVQALAVRVSEAYFELLLADEQTALVEAQKASYTTQLDAATKGFAAGAGTRTDIDEVRARLDLTAAEELRTRQHRLLARRQLQSMVTEPFAAVAPLDIAALRLTTPEPAELDAWIARAESRSPEIQAARAQVEVARLAVAKSRAGHLPTLDAVAELARSENDNINRIGSRYTTRMIGLQLSVPLYSGGGVDSAVRQSLAEEVRALETLEALRLDLGVRVYREFAGVSEGVLRIRALEQAVRSAEQVVQSNRKSFQGGSRTTVDVLNAQQQHVTALRDLAQARYLYLMSRVRLDVLAGAFDAERLREINAFLRPAKSAAATTANESIRSAAAADRGRNPEIRRPL
jgi:outer membrane protein, protease secretion system